MRRPALSILALAAVLAGISPSAAQQPAFPSKPVKMILPIPAGTALDVVVRALGDSQARNPSSSKTGPAVAASSRLRR